MRTPNRQQLAVIDEWKENILLFASAGTGKTFTIAHRIAKLLAQNEAKAEEILCLTFTIKASNEMKEDILEIAGEIGEGVLVNTIHGFCYKLLTEENKRTGGSYGELGVCDEVDQEEILKSILSSRYSYWRLEKNLRGAGIPPIDLQGCKVGMMGERLVWQAGNKRITEQGDLLVTEGELSPIECVCPNCKELQTLTSNRCPACGEELLFRLEKKEFEVYRKRTGLRNLISEIKHCREEGEFFSGEEGEDYQRAYEYLKENKREAYERLISYYARYLGYAPDEVFAEAMDEFAGRLTAEYDQHLRLSNLLDFDDLIMQAKRVLLKEDALDYWSKRFSYIVLDEMQDTSRLEFSLLKKLFVGNNVMLCGDFFQTIYGWRGSRPQEILEEYVREFSAKIYMLSVNYRASKTLAAASFEYLKSTYPHLVGKFCPKDLEIEGSQEGEKIFCYAFDNREEEAAQIYKHLLRTKNEEGSVCVLARTNKYIAELAAYFDRFSAKEKEPLRFFTVEENFQFFKKPLVKDVLAVIKLLLNPLDRVSMERITGKYVRRVGAKAMEYLRAKNEVGVSVCSFLAEQTHTRGDSYSALLEAYNAETIVVYDTETTGLDLQKAEPVQIAAIKMGKRGEVIDTLNLFIEPTVPIEEGALQTHGFTLAYIRANGGVSVREGLEKFAVFSKGSVLVGHNNLGYDKPLVERLLKEHGLPKIEAVAEYDTLTIAKQFYPALDNYKLETLCRRFGVKNERAHNALGDILATGECLRRMIEESVLPTAMERREILGKYAPKFEKLHAFMKALQERLEGGEPLVSAIAEGLMLTKHYPTRVDERTLQDLIESLDAPCADRRAFLAEYVKDAALSGSQMDLLIAKSNKIPIITVHQAKGCEFDKVIIAGADDSNFPSFAAKQSGSEDEEKKIFYVAITRAKQRLILTRVLRNGSHHLDETPYFWGLPEEYVRVNRAWKNGNE